MKTLDPKLQMGSGCLITPYAGQWCARLLGHKMTDDQAVPLKFQIAGARFYAFRSRSYEGQGPTVEEAALEPAAFAALAEKNGWTPDPEFVAGITKRCAIAGLPSTVAAEVLAGVGVPATSAASPPARQHAAAPSSAPNSTGRDYPAESGLSGGWVSTHFPTRTENPQPRSFTPSVIDTPPTPSPTAVLTAHLPKRFYADGQAIGAESAGRNVFADHLVVQLDRLKGDTFIESASKIQRDNEQKKRDRLSKIAATELAFRQR